MNYKQPKGSLQKRRRASLQVRRPERRAVIDAWRARNPGKTAKYKRNWLLRNPAKRAAHIAVGNAVRDGKLLKGLCEKCGNPKVTAHHDNYADKLNVRWLCRKHHGEIHRIHMEWGNKA